MSHEAINRQPVPGNFQEEKPFTFQCSGIVLVDHKTLFENQLMCYQSGVVACTAAVGCLQVACKGCLVWQGPYCSGIVLVDYKTLSENQLMCYQSGVVACTAVGCLQIACKGCLVWQGPYCMATELSASHKGHFPNIVLIGAGSGLMNGGNCSKFSDWTSKL